MKNVRKGGINSHKMHAWDAFWHGCQGGEVDLLLSWQWLHSLQVSGREINFLNSREIFLQQLTNWIINRTAVWALLENLSFTQLHLLKLSKDKIVFRPRTINPRKSMLCIWSFFLLLFAHKWNIHNCILLLTHSSFALSPSRFLQSIRIPALGIWLTLSLWSLS